MRGSYETRRDGCHPQDVMVLPAAGGRRVGRLGRGGDRRGVAGAPVPDGGWVEEVRACCPAACGVALRHPWAARVARVMGVDPARHLPAPRPEFEFTLDLLLDGLERAASPRSRASCAAEV